MNYEFKLRKTIEFAETDMAGIVHFSNYFRYMEMAEHAFFRSLGFSVHPHDPDYHGGWPRVGVECEYMKPLRFEDEIEVHLKVKKKGRRSLTYQCTICNLAFPDQIVAKGSLTVVHTFHHPETRRMKAAIIPAEIADKISVAPEFQKKD